MIPLIGSLLGLGTQGLALGINQAQRASSRDRLAQAPTTGAARAEFARRLNAQQQAGGFNPMLAQRNAAEAQTNASLRFSGQDMQARQRANAMKAQAEREDANALMQGLVGLGSGLAAGSAQLATTMGEDKKIPGLGAMVGGEQGKLDARRKQSALGQLGVDPFAQEFSAAPSAGAGGLGAPSSQGAVVAPTPQAPPTLQEEGLGLPQENFQPLLSSVLGQRGASLQPTGAFLPGAEAVTAYSPSEEELRRARLRAQGINIPPGGWPR